MWEDVLWNVLSGSGNAGHVIDAWDSAARIKICDMLWNALSTEKPQNWKEDHLKRSPDLLPQLDMYDPHSFWSCVFIAWIC